MTPVDLARFESFVHPEPTTGCWIWRGVCTQAGYGRLGSRHAHRLSYEHFIGPIPEGLELDHVRARGCCGPSCVNPAHLEAVTHRENMLRDGGWGAKNARKTHCPQGHEYTPENMYGRKPNQRKCRICHNEGRRTGRPIGRPRLPRPHVSERTLRRDRTGR